MTSEAFGTGDITNLEFQFNFYLEKIGADPKNMSAIQYSETKRAFYGAILQFLILLNGDLTKLSEKDFVDTCDRMFESAHAFWKKEAQNEQIEIAVKTTFPISKGGIA